MNRKKKDQKNQNTKEKLLDYEDFIKEIVAEIKNYVNSQTEVIPKETLKNNDVCQKGILIMEKGENIAPILYLEPFYMRYLEGMELKEIAEEIYKIYLINKNSQTLDVTDFEDYKKIQGRILFKLINYEWNKKLLNELPYRKCLDLAAVFYCPLAKDKSPVLATVMIKKEHLALWGITKEELAERAFRNTPRLLGHKLLDMEDIRKDYLSGGEKEERFLLGEEAPKMQILTNRCQLNGAACLLYPKLLAELAEEEKANFIILPSSIHETLLLSTNDSMEAEGMQMYTQMVKEVNRIHLAEEEILSDHAYFYDRCKAELYAI